MTRFVLVRHGESQVTVDRVVGGPRSCRGLSEHGRWQAEQLRDRWATRPELAFDAVYSSAFPRAKETAEIVLPVLGGPELFVEPDLGEHDPGPDCDGLTYQQFEEKFGSPDWEADPYGVTFPGGETIAEFQLRVGSAVRRLCDRHPDATLAVFCHGGVIDTVLRQSLRSFGTGSFEIHTKNTSITEVELVRAGRWRLVRYNDVAHLPVAGPPVTGLSGVR